MTQEYVGLDPENTKSKFTDSQFLVFINRTLALIVSVIYLYLTSSFKHPAPLFKFSYASFSNIMSAWCQYEALKYVNFPTQVLAKSTKIIPVMIMGKIISRTKYEFHEYLTAVMISIGMILFLTGSADESKASPTTTLTGLFLLVIYLLFDSFTSNWQDYLTKNYSITSMQMMCGVNIFSSLFTATSLFFQGGFLVSINFALLVCYEFIFFLFYFPTLFFLTISFLTSSTLQLASGLGLFSYFLPVLAILSMRLPLINI